MNRFYVILLTYWLSINYTKTLLHNIYRINNPISIRCLLVNISTKLMLDDIKASLMELGFSEAEATEMANKEYFELITSTKCLN